MPSVSYLQKLSALPSPLLTVYVDTNATKQENRRRVPAYFTWLKTQAKSIAHQVPEPEQKSLQEQVERVQHFLRDQGLKPRGLLILAGPETWEQIPLRLEFKNELHWGKPYLAQLFDSIQETEPSCVVVVDRSGVRFFRYDLSGIAALEEMKFHVDTSQWKTKEHEHMARPGTPIAHGPQRDAFNQRIDAQYLHLCQQVAERTQILCKKQDLSAVFLVGSKRLTEPIEEKLPPVARSNVSLIEEDLGNASSSELEERLAPKIADWESQRAAQRVDQLLASDHGAIIGIDETLARLQAGTIGSLFFSRGLDARLHQCEKCGLVNRSADPVCPNCGSKRRAVMLREILPELAHKHETDIEVVGGIAAEKLSRSGGMGGWLRKSVRAGAS